MNEEQTRMLSAYLSNGMKVLSTRVMLFLVVILTFSLFAWAMYMPDTNRIVVAGMFGALVFLPTLSYDGKKLAAKVEQE